PVERGNDRRRERDDCRGFLRDQRHRSERDAQRVHRIEASARALTEQRERRGRERAPHGEVGGSPCQSSQVVSSKVALAASSPTGYPAMTSSPASPSTWLRRVAAATTSSRPLEIIVSYAMAQSYDLVHD